METKPGTAGERVVNRAQTAESDGSPSAEDSALTGAHEENSRLTEGLSDGGIETVEEDDTAGSGPDD